MRKTKVPPRRPLAELGKPIRRPKRVLVCGGIGLDPKSGVRRYAMQQHWVVVEGEWYPNSLPSQIARHYDVSGVITTLDIPIDEVSRRRVLTESAIPVVLVDLFLVAQGFPVPQVTVDHRLGGRLVAEHFLERQFRHLAYCLPGPHPALLLQMEGFQEAANAAGAEFHCLDFQKRLHEFGWDAANFRRWLAAELAPVPKPLGLMVDSDHTALEAVEACLERGILVPERVAVVGCWNNQDVCFNSLLPLSSLEVGPARHGYQAAWMLDELMQGRSLPEQVVTLPPQAVVVRQSSDMAAVPHLDVARAVHFIMHNYTNPLLQVDDVVAATALSRPGLNLAFHKHVRCSVVDYIRQTRLKRALELLQTTRAPVREVATRCGYRDHQHLRTTLYREEGLSPREWRRVHADGAASPEE